jgi:transcription elongation GreA/GreB family factor
MSKAFTREDDTLAGAPLLVARAAEPAPITPSGLRALRAELAQLVDQGAGDTHRARSLERMLGSVVETRPALLDGGVGFGCLVTLLREDGAHVEVELVGPDEVDARKGKISASSPVGRALLRKKPGDIVELPRPSGAEEVEVLDVKLSE